MKNWTGLLSLLLAASLLAGCGAASDGPETSPQTVPTAKTEETQPQTAPQTQPLQETEPTEALPTEEPAEKIQLDVVVGWYGYDDPEWWLKFEAEFEGENPDVDLAIEVTSWMELGDGAEAMADRNDKPDILNTTSVYSRVYREKGLLLPAADYLSDQTRDRIYPRLMDWYEEDGAAWGLPIVSIPWVMIYNPEILEAAEVSVPSSWEELENACEAIKRAMPEVIPWGLDLISDDALGIWLFNNGGGFVDENGEWFINSDENLEAVQFLENMYYSGLISKDFMLAGWSMLQDQFMEGKVAMMPLPMNGLAYWEYVECTVPYELALIPSNTGCESASLATVDYLVCFDKGQSREELEAIGKFFDFFYEDQRHKDYIDAVGLYPVTAGAAGLMADAEPELALLDEILASARTLPIVKNGWLDIYWDADDFLRKVLEDGSNPARLLDELQYEAGGN